MTFIGVGEWPARRAELSPNATALVDLATGDVSITASGTGVSARWLEYSRRAFTSDLGTVWH